MLSRQNICYLYHSFKTVRIVISYVCDMRYQNTNFTGHVTMIRQFSSPLQNSSRCHHILILDLKKYITKMWVLFKDQLLYSSNYIVRWR
jgi:hypothetical protein